MSVNATLIQISLSDPPQPGVLIPAISWAVELIFGPLATSIAVIAIALVGFAMLSGQIAIRRGLSVLLGCFLLFGAKGITNGLQREAAREYPETAAVLIPSQPVYPSSSSPTNNRNAFDPYAGAAVR